MAGYRRVNYYELCRLCTSSEGTKMHIFREEGRRRQLPTKIQICLPVQVCEDDSLPKIICSHCVEKLESFYDFRESCVNAESMLESYFTSLRYSDDLSREGKVYVKEGSPPKKKPSEVEIVTKNNHKATVIAAPDGLSSLVEAAGIQIVSEVDAARVQQYKCAMQIPAGAPGTTVMDTASTAADARYAYEACGPTSPRLSDASPSATTATSVETHQTKLEDGSTQCNETDFKNNGIVRHHQTSADSSDEGEVGSHQQQLQSVAFAAAVPGQEMLLHFSFKQERDGVLRTEEQTALQRSSIAQIGEFLRMKSANIVDNGVQASVVELPTSPLRPCMRCGKSFTNVEELQSHTPCNQDSLADTSPDKGGLNGGTISCDVCNKLFKRKEHLFQHRKLHTGERPYVCSSCGKAFSRKEHLVRHTVSHTGQKAHACEMCGKSFSRKDNLHKHRKTHGIAGPYICESCGKSFVVKHNYVMHKSSHACSGLVNDDVGAASLENPLPYKCDICNKGFAMKQYLLTHKQRHRSRGARANAANATNTVNMVNAVNAIPVVPSVSIPSVTSPTQPVVAVSVTPTSQTATTTGQSAAAMGASCDSSLVTGTTGNAAGPATVAIATVAVATSASSSHNPQSPPSQQQQALQQAEQQQQQHQDESAQQQASQPSQQPPQQSQPPQPTTVQLDPLALTHNNPLTLPSSPLLAPGLLQHVAPGVTGSSANPTMAIHVSSAATAYLCNPSNDLLETYRRLHST